MADKSKIEWTEASWNPIVGCTKVSAGCDNCYAMHTAHRNAAMGSERYLGTTRIINARPQWTGVVKFVPEALQKPLHWRAPRKIFVNSMSDLFHADVQDEWIDKVFAVMALCPQHIFQILTKRPERMREYLDMVAGEKDMKRWGNAACEVSGSPCAAHIEDLDFPLKNVHLGVSVEDQKAADLRIPLLLQTPAAVRWLSCEPLLGPVELLAKYDLPAFGVGWSDSNSHYDRITAPRIHWVVVGGESGPRARPMHPDWARSLRDQCVAADVPYFFKQWGEWYPMTRTDGIHECPLGNYSTTGNPDCVIPDGRKFYAGFIKKGKKNSGRMLDGREWSEYPR